MSGRMIPAIAGAAQTIQRPGDWRDPRDAKGPIELMVDAARAAAEDARAPQLLGKVGWIGVAGGIPYRDPGRLVGALIGAPDARTALSMPSGSSPQELVGIAAEHIANGEIDAALVLGGDAAWNARQLRSDGREPQWTTGAGDGEPEVVSAMPRGAFERLGAPADVYAVFGDSLRLARGRSMDEYRDEISELWSRFSAVAATNPYAWDTTPHSAAAIREPSPDNRMIAHPYTKAMVANNTVNLSSAVLLCSRQVASGAGISRDRLVFPHVVTTSHDTWRAGSRDVLHRAPAMAAAGRAALSRAGIGAGDVAHVDLYSCFPSIVQMSAEALGFDQSRPLTVTGGLGFAGAPLANASGQAIAALVPLVRAGGWGFVHANGGYATKHAFGVYANHPPDSYVLQDCDDVERGERGELPEDWDGKGTVEAATVAYGREAASHVLAAIISEDGRRGWTRSTDDAIIAAAVEEGIAGRTMRRSSDGTLLD